MSHPFQPLTAKEVAQYLSEHTDFFVDYPELTADLIIPHQQRGTVSLVELQAEQLRTQLHQQRQELAALIRNARSRRSISAVAWRCWWERAGTSACPSARTEPS